MCVCVLLKLAILQIRLLMRLVILILCWRCCHKMTKMICQLSDKGFNIFVFIIPRNIDILKYLRFFWDNDAWKHEDVDVFISMLIFPPASQRWSRSHLQIKSGDRQTNLLIKAANSGRAARPGIRNPFIIPNSFKPEYQYHLSQCRISKP